MAGKIPEETLDRIKHSVNIVDVIHDYVQLSKQGKNYFGLCPFHGEKTPSFSVSPDKQIYHCFGCGAGGNVFTFLMEIENISFQEAAVQLAERAGIKLNVDITAEPVQALPKDHELMMSAHELLAKFYHHLLINTKEGQNALEYLFSRGFTKDQIEKFQIGWSPTGWNVATLFLKRRGFPISLMEKAGLVIRHEGKGDYYDRFRDRIMFPLHDSKGRVVAFSGRSLRDLQPKYLNSPETPIFHKSRLLYNLNRSRNSIRKKRQLILFEGFADCIAADRAGIDNGVSTMGTSLTEDHVHIIRRLTDEVLICYDGDSAGVEAAFRAGNLLEEAGCRVKVSVIPDDLDPDDYIQTYGGDKFRLDVIEASMTYMAFKMQYYKRGKNLQKEDEKLQYIDEILKEITKLSKAVERDYYMRQLAEEFSISLDALKWQQRQIYYAEKRNLPPSRPNWAGRISEKPSTGKIYPAYITAERRLIAYMLQDPELAYQIHEKLAGETFNLDEHQAIFTYLLGYYEEGKHPDASAFINFLPDPNLRKTVTEIEMMNVNMDVSDEEINDYINEVLNHQKMLKIKAKMEESKRAEQQHDYKKAAAIAMEVMQLRKMLKRKGSFKDVGRRGTNG
ncbi:DNA primase [Bacillus smithii]|uniref:DNA primase n=1 Tax=Bacillus smithii 7_3_47FAA TaxID=665952 RepID=G9QPT4_9BACI|nr:DNA primase [Bacillus smithii]EHL73725.1 DNA primase [Bacillus smithii 7_3_47FAA]